MSELSLSHEYDCECDDCEEEELVVDAHLQTITLSGVRCLSMCNEFYEKYCLKRPMRDSVLNGHQWVMELWKDHERRFFQNMRMRKSVMQHLISVLVASCDLDTSSKRVSVEESMAIFLLVVGQGVTYPVVEERVQRSSETISNHFHMVLDAICKLGRHVVKPKSSTSGQQMHECSSDPYFNHAIGAIDGTHITVHIPASERNPWYNRKGVTSTNVLAICDFDMHIMFAQVGMEGSMHDSHVLTECWKRPNTKFPFPLTGKYYLVDAGYPLLRGFLTPYRRTRYHLPKYRANRVLTRPNEFFNYKHSSLRSVIERTFGVLKRRWRVMTNMASVSLETQMKIIWACITLHNFIRRYDANDIRLLGHISIEDDGLSSILRQGERDEWFSSYRNAANEMELLRDNIRNAIVESRNIN